MSANEGFHAMARPCSNMRNNRIKPSFTFVRNWETVVTPPQAQETDGKDKSLSGVLLSPRSHTSHNSSLSSIAENSPTPVIISHRRQSEPGVSCENADEINEKQDEDNDDEGDAYGANEEDSEATVVNGDDDGVADNTEGSEADDENEVDKRTNSPQDSNAQVVHSKDKSRETDHIDDDESTQPAGAGSDVPSHHLMPPPAAPRLANGLVHHNNEVEEHPDVSPIPATVGIVHQTPVSAGIKRKSTIMTSTPAPFQKDTPKDTPDFEVIDTTKRLKLASSPFVPARKKSAISQSVSSHQKSTPTDESDSELSDMSEVQLWVGAGPMRKLSDATELDVLLTAVEEVSYQFKQTNSTPLKRKTVNEFVLKVRKEMTDVVDSIQELKSATSALSKTTQPLKMAYKDLVEKQKEYFNLVEREADLEENKKSFQKQKALSDISEWLFDLEDLQTRYRRHMGDSQDQEDYSTRENLPALLKEAKANLTAAKRLKIVNDQVEELLKKRQNSSRQGRHLRDVLK